MEINTIITINKNNYLLTQKVNYNNTEYFMAIAVDEKDQLLHKYGIFKEVEKDSKKLVDLVRDPKEKKAVYELLAKDFNTEVLKDKDLMPVGQLVSMKNRQFVLLDYIPYNESIYMVFITIEKPCDIVVCLRGMDKQGKIHLYDVTAEDIGIEILQLFAKIHKDNK